MPPAPSSSVSLRSSLARRARVSVRARGYTAVEVLMAMTVMAIGTAAVISMVRTSVQGNLDARKTDVANAIARTWVERLQRDAMQWTCPSPACATGNLDRAKLFAGTGSASAPANITGKWFLPVDLMQSSGSTNPETMSPGFDILGRDLPSSLLLPDTTNGSGWPGATFCVNVRLTWLVTNELVRADVRVLWPRGVYDGPPTTGFCNSTVAANDDPEAGITSNQHPFFRTIYTTTSIMETPAQ
jgi:prepilin-type N-terminal cleavage/methylation domain-containing protein